MIDLMVSRPLCMGVRCNCSSSIRGVWMGLYGGLEGISLSTVDPRHDYVHWAGMGW